MAVFKVFVAVHRGMESVQFGPGDEVPDWAVGLVGDHCVEDAPSKASAPAADPEPEPSDPGPAEVAPLDFTAPAKPARGRPRKP